VVKRIAIAALKPWRCSRLKGKHMNTVSPVNFETQQERTRLSWALAALLVMALPHALHLAPWIVLAAAVVTLWRLGATYQGWPLFSRYARIGFGLLAFIGVFATYHTLNGPEAGTALLILLAALKLMEARGLRDYFFLLVITLFIGIANFLYDQTIPLAIYMIPAVWLAISALLNIAHPDVNRTTAMSLKITARMLLLVLPLALVLFLLFPRIPGPLWGLSLPEHSGITGLSTKMSPGSLSRLAQSDAIAFQVKFQGPIPPRSQLYWRALVLHDYDGDTWTEGTPLWNNNETLSTRGEPVHYQVTLEPNNLHVLYGLDLPVQVPDNVQLTSDYELSTRHDVTERKLYTVTSYTEYSYGTNTPRWILHRDLQLPRDIDPRARQLAQQWNSTASSSQQVVQDALSMFHDQPFRYTLQPGELTGPDRVDAFLFDTRRGFCEHYASAFVFLMRAAGIPAHVVIGYQGGLQNPMDGYYVVRQEDAHAWAEVWLAGRGWVRVDPTAAVDPARVDQGLAASLPGSEVPDYFINAHPWLANLRNTWDAVNNGWNQWVLAYGPELQQRFFAHIGLDYGNWLQLALVMLLVIGGILGLIWLLLWWRSRTPPPPSIVRDYRRFCHKLAMVGLPRRPNEGPLNYAKRILRKRPDLAGPVKAITTLYINLRYADTGDAQELKRLIQNFRPRYA
jgi:protein-glutamine gamma-glutamyltransferase